MWHVEIGATHAWNAARHEASSFSWRARVGDVGQYHDAFIAGYRLYRVKDRKMKTRIEDKERAILSEGAKQTGERFGFFAMDPVGGIVHRKVLACDVRRKYGGNFITPGPHSFRISCCNPYHLARSAIIFASNGSDDFR